MTDDNSGLGLIILAAAGIYWLTTRNATAATAPAAQPYGDPAAPIVSVALPGLEKEAEYTANQIRRHQQNPSYRGGF